MAGMDQLLMPVAFLFIALTAVSVFGAVWRWIKGRKARREYLENHPRYLHNGGNRKPS